MPLNSQIHYMEDNSVQWIVNIFSSAYIEQSAG